LILPIPGFGRSLVLRGDERARPRDHRRVGRRHVDRVHPDAEGRVVDRRIPRHPVHRMLRGDIGRVARKPGQARDRGDVHDRAARALGQHLAQLVAHRQEDALHVGAEDAVPVFLGRLVDRREDEVLLRRVVDGVAGIHAVHDARVVERGIDPAEGLDRDRDHARAGLVPADIARDERVLWPAAAISSIAAFPCASSQSTPTTFAPSRASRHAAPWPMPRAQPVTSTVFPANRSGTK
jgi:hypothetical protein